MVEAMIAISLLLVGFLGTITLINRSVGLTRVVADSYVGTYLAAEGIEVVKSMIDANYLADRPFFDGFAGCTTSGCNWELEYKSTWETDPPVVTTNRKLWYNPRQGTYSYGPIGTPSPFTRTVTVQLVGPTARQLNVTSRVEWVTRGGGLTAVVLEDRFYDWYLATSTASSTP